MPVIVRRIARELAAGTASAVKGRIAACVQRIAAHVPVLVVAQMKQRVVASTPWPPASVWPCPNAAQESGLRNARMQPMIAGAAMENAVGRTRVRGVRKMALRPVSARKTPTVVKWSGQISVVDLPASVWGAAEMDSAALESPAAIVLMIVAAIRQPRYAMQRPVNALVSVGMEHATRTSLATPVPLNAGRVKGAVVWPMRPRVVWTRTPWIAWEPSRRVVSWMSGLPCA